MHKLDTNGLITAPKTKVEVIAGRTLWRGSTGNGALQIPHPMRARQLRLPQLQAGQSAFKGEAEGPLCCGLMLTVAYSEFA